MPRRDDTVYAKGLENPILSAVLMERLRRKVKSFDLSKLLFPQQLAFANDRNLFVTVCASRRSGKTYAIAAKMVDQALKYYPKTFLYIGLTRHDAKQILLPMLQSVCNSVGIPMIANTHKTEIKLPTGSIIQISSSDQEGLAERFRGKSFAGVFLDEAQSYRVNLKYLVNEVLSYTVAEHRAYGYGQVHVTGTPSRVAAGFFYDIWHNLGLGYSKHHWTIFDNPFFPNPREFLNDYLAKTGLTEDSPEVQREFYGRWVTDAGSLVYPFTKQNLTTELPEANDWTYVLAFDLAYHPDATAFVVGAYSIEAQKFCIVQAFKESELTVTDAAKILDDLTRRYNPTKIIGDLGALGKMVGAEFRSRFQLPVTPADKAAKAYFQRLLKSDILTNRVLIVENRCQQLLDEAARLDWVAQGQKMIENPTRPNDICDAMLYAWRESYHYLTRPQIQSEPEDELERYQEELYARGEMQW